MDLAPTPATLSYSPPHTGTDLLFHELRVKAGMVTARLAVGLPRVVSRIQEIKSP